MTKVAKLLIKHSANINYINTGSHNNCFTPLHAAIKS